MQVISDIWYGGQLRVKKILVNELKNNEKADVITIIMNDEPLKILNQFKYLGATLTKYGKSKVEINIRIATATSTLVRLITIWKSRNISQQTQNITVKFTNIVYTTLWLRNLDTNRNTGKKNYCI